MSESLIWSMMNDQRNSNIILQENEDLKNFVPKVAIEKIEVNEVVENTEEVVEKIITDNYDNHTALMILHDQLKIATFLVSQFKKSEPENISWNSFRPGLKWILDTSEFILNKVNIVPNVFANDKVHRCSYKFCSSRENCNTLYDNVLQNSSVKKKSCSGDHYVHHKIVQDLKCLITVTDEDKSTLYQDLRVGLNTLVFVITKMYQELNIFQIYLGKSPQFNINTYYNVKNLKEPRNDTRTREGRNNKYNRYDKHNKRGKY